MVRLSEEASQEVNIIKKILRGGKMAKKSILIVAVVLAVGIGLIGGYLLWRHYGFSPQQTIMADSFILSVHDEKYMSEQELQEYAAWLEEVEGYPDEYPEYWYRGISFPFNRFGMYLNHFFLQKNEVVEVVMKSPEPLGIVDVGEDSPSLVPLSFLITIGPDALTPSYAPPFTLNRINGNWELRFTFKAEKDGYYLLIVFNDTPDQIWCQYAVILKNLA